MLLSVKNLTKTFGNQVAVNDISFAIPEAKVVGFLGPNGAGKSTTMKMIAGFMRPSIGHVRIHDIDVQEKEYAAKQLLGYLPENNPLYGSMYIRESLEYTGRLYRLENLSKRIAEVIDMVGLGNERQKKIKQLSKGYKQRLGIAQALLHNPPLLILDEPTAGLDPNQLHEIRNLIRLLGQEKVVVLSTHIMQEVEAICQEVIFIHKGSLVGDFSIEKMPEIFENKNLEQVFYELTK
ncbi:ATP-binding cassette domain-containing protein [Olivibacter sp. CPCC 100613]|uniref:ABC transporter ATP-binding protein n=1 Tax=Olivibacter sp. CPCC 100613 TaxID=3079931 RepID=UPI002FFB5230